MIADMHITDLRLPLTITRSLLEIDSAIAGEKVAFEASRQLASFIKDTLGVSSEANPAQLDFCAVQLIESALAAVHPGKTQYSVSEAVKAAGEFVALMEHPDQVRNLEELRTFVLAFGNDLLSYRESFREPYQSQFE